MNFVNITSEKAEPMSRTKFKEGLLKNLQAELMLAISSGNKVSDQDMKKVKLKVTYEFNVCYEHEEHLNDIKKDLRNAPIHNRSGAGCTKDNKFGGYSCSMKKKSGAMVKEN